MMMNSLLLDDNMSNLTSASNDQPSISSSTLYPQQSFSSSPNQPPPAKKKRNLPGNPDPEAEVVALSPRSLMATNRFMCEICNKGFQRDQNLQLHRRGHNLPWKLKQRPKQELIKKKVYVCPEATCVHHDPSRALGDLTGIKKHFFRKHGEKKWKCEKCSKRYAVQSDWKAHSKVCGTREYRCDCGTLFSRRDSFVTHRAFCDALAEESGARGITTTLSQNNNHHHPLLSHLQQPSSTSHFNLPPHLQQLQVPFPLKIEQQDHHHLPQWLDNHNHHQHQLFPLPNPSHSCMPTTPSLPPLQPTLPSPHMSATALLQKAAQMGVTMSSKQQPAGPSLSSSESMLMSRPHQAAAHVMTNLSYASSLAASTAVVNLDLSAREEVGSGFVTSGCVESAHPPPRTPHSLLQNHHHHHHHVMMSNSMPSGSGFQEISSFEEALNGILNHKMGGGGSGGGNEGLTRDFLGLRGFPPQRGFPNMGSTGFDQMNPPSSSLDHHHDQQNQNQTPWQG